MANVDSTNVTAIPRLGPAPERIGGVCKAPARVDALPKIGTGSTKAAVKRPGALLWTLKRLAILFAVGAASHGAFVFTGFIPFRVVAAIFPFAYWIKICVDFGRVHPEISSRSYDWSSHDRFGPHVPGTFEWRREQERRMGF